MSLDCSYKPRSPVLLHLPLEPTLISRQKQPASNPAATWRAENGEVQSSPHAGTSPSSGLCCESHTSPLGHLLGWVQRGRCSHPPPLSKSWRHAVNLTTPGRPGDLRPPDGAPHLSAHIGMLGRSPCSSQGGGMSHASPNQHSPPNAVSALCKPLSPFNQELKLRLISALPSPSGPAA